MSLLRLQQDKRLSPIRLAYPRVPKNNAMIYVTNILVAGTKFIPTSFSRTFFLEINFLIIEISFSSAFVHLLAIQAFPICL